MKGALVLSGVFFISLAAANAEADAWKTQIVAAQNLSAQGRYVEAEQVLRQALRLAKGFEDRIAVTFNNLGTALSKQWRFHEAEQMYERSRAVREASGGFREPGLVAVLNNLGALYLTLDRRNDAEVGLRRALEIWRATDDVSMFNGAMPTSLALAGEKLLENLAHIEYLEGDYESSIAFWKEAVVLTQRNHGSGHLVAHVEAGLAVTYVAQGEDKKGKELLRQSIEKLKQALGAADPTIVKHILSLAILYFQTQEYSEAEIFFLDALAVASKAYGPEHPMTALVLMEYSKVLAKTRRGWQARQLEKNARKTMARHSKENFTNHTVDVSSFNGRSR